MASSLSSKKISALFLTHGAGPAAFINFPTHHPLHSFDKTSSTAAFLREFPKYVSSGGEVKNILVISAHWEEKQFTVGYQENGSSIYYDYGGFPKEAYPPYLTYECSTDLVLANLIQSLLITAGVPCGKKDRGFDHGVFCPLKASYPEGNIPIVQLSMKKGLSIEDHIRLGEILAPLRSEGTLIIGSGAMSHSSAPTKQQSQEYSAWFESIFKNATENNYQESRARLLTVETDCPHVHLLHPTLDHLVPIFVTFGTTIPSATHTESQSVEEQQVVGNDGTSVDVVAKKGTIHSAFHELDRYLIDNYVFDL